MNNEEFINQMASRIAGKVWANANIHNDDIVYNSIKEIVEKAINNALQDFKQQMARAIAEEMYSDEKFEHDIGLTK